MAWPGSPQPLLLVGAGGLAREVLAAVRTDPDRWKPIGLVDDDARRHGTHVDGLPVLGPVDAVAGEPDAAVVVCVANPARPTARLDLARRIGLAPERCATVVHPSADVPAGTRIGAGTVLLAGCVVTAPLQVGAHVLAMPLVLLTHDVEVGDGATLAGRATLAGGVRVGDCAYVGQSASIRERVRIGSRAVVGMGAVVLSDVPDDEVWAGVPAHRLRVPNERI